MILLKDLKVAGNADETSMGKNINEVDVARYHCIFSRTLQGHSKDYRRIIYFNNFTAHIST